MTDEEVKTLVARYEMDAGITYDLSAQELQVLLAEVGENSEHDDLCRRCTDAVGAAAPTAAAND